MTPPLHPLIAAAEAIAQGTVCAMATVISADGSTPRRAGARMLIYENGDIVGSVGGGRLERETIDAARACIADGQPRRIQPRLADDLGMCCAGGVEVFVDPLDVRAPAVVYGAGHVAAAVVPLLLTLGFQVTVVDARAELLTAARFPACHRELVDPIEHAANLTDHSRRAVLVMTHDHGQDVRIVAALSRRKHAYLGMLGARRKRDHLARHLAESPGADLGVLDRIHAPIGLDIGAANPAEIAVAIAAEIVAVRAARAPTHGSLPLAPRN